MPRFCGLIVAVETLGEGWAGGGGSAETLFTFIIKLLIRYKLLTRSRGHNP